MYKATNSKAGERSPVELGGSMGEIESSVA